MGFKEMTAIQAQAIPEALMGRDILGFVSLVLLFLLIILLVLLELAQARLLPSSFLPSNSSFKLSSNPATVLEYVLGSFQLSRELFSLISDLGACHCPHPRARSSNLWCCSRASQVQPGEDPRYRPNSLIFDVKRSDTQLSRPFISVTDLIR